MKIKVTATHYVNASTWYEAEKQVEYNLSQADTIESEPAGRDPKDMIAFAISSKIYDEHNKIFFEPEDNASTMSYKDKLDSLKYKTNNWILNIIDDVIETNEEGWT